MLRVAGLAIGRGSGSADHDGRKSWDVASSPVLDPLPASMVELYKRVLEMRYLLQRGVLA